MTSGRSEKRARQKERRASRREEYRQAIARRRRQRWGVLLGSLGVIVIGALIFLVASGSDENPSGPSPSASAPVDEALAAPIKEPVACDAKLPKSAGSKKSRYEEAPDQKLDSDKTYIWKLETSCGDIEIELDVKESPETANSIVFLTREGFYDGLVFHRILKGFVVQGGDPLGDGTGDAGYDVVEAPPDDFKYTEGVVAMAKGGPDAPGTSSSQFFIVSGEEGASLPPEYAYVGNVTDGDATVADLEDLGHDADGPPPTAWAYIERATIIEK